MKFLTLPLSLVALSAFSSVADEIVYAPEEDLRVQRTFVAEARFSLDAVELIVDGEEQETGETVAYDILNIERIVVTDELVSIEDGRPTEFKRTFDELLQTTEFELEDAEEELPEKTSSSALEGTTVVFTWDEDEEEYTVTPDEDEEIEDELLADMLDDMDFRALLPDGEVDPDDSWEIDASVYLTVMWPGGLLHFTSDDAEDEEEGESDMNRAIIDALEGEGKATYLETRDEDGVRVAVIAVEFEISSEVELESDDEDLPDRLISITRTIEGVVLWNLEAGLLHSASLEADAVLRQGQSQSFETPDGEVDLVQTLVYEGTIEYEATVEIVE